MVDFKDFNGPSRTNGARPLHDVFYGRHDVKGFSVSMRGVLSYVKALQGLGVLDVSVKL